MTDRIEQPTDRDPRTDLARRITAEGRVNFLAILLRVARADDVSPAERNQLGPVAVWIGAGDDDLTHAIQKADDTEISETDLVEGLQTFRDRMLLFRECCAVVWVDGYRSDQEQVQLERLAFLLNVDEGTQAVLDSAIACSPEGERRFLELLARASTTTTE